MATLLLRLAAPLQAWGTDDSKFETRKTEREPTKSGVLGMVAAALGYRRDEPEKLKELTKLRMGVRVDREGKLLRDFHTAHEIRTPKSHKNLASYISDRYYLSDAVFLVGLEGDDELLESIALALTHPVFPLFLGRRSCPPTLPVLLGIRQNELLDALIQEEPLVEIKQPREARLYADGGLTDAKNVVGHAAKRDLPISYDPHCRKFGYRTVSECHPVLIKKDEDVPVQTKHDPFSELEDRYVSIEN